MAVPWSVWECCKWPQISLDATLDPNPLGPDLEGPGKGCEWSVWVGPFERNFRCASIPTAPCEPEPKCLSVWGASWRVVTFEYSALVLPASILLRFCDSLLVPNH